MIADSELQHGKWTKWFPPVVDTVLLVSAIVLAINIQQYPFIHSWVTAKVIALLLYIGLGMVALTYGKTKTIRVTAWIAALLAVTYIVLVALTKNPMVLF